MTCLSAAWSRTVYLCAAEVRPMPAPTLPEKRWSIDLEKKIQEAHSENEQEYTAR